MATKGHEKGAQAQDLMAQEGHRGLRFGPRIPSDSPEPSRAWETLAMFPSLNLLKVSFCPADLLTVNGPFQVLELFPSPSCPSVGAGPILSPLFIFFSVLLTSYSVLQGFIQFPEVFQALHQCLVGALVVRSHEFPSSYSTIWAPSFISSLPVYKWACKLLP